MHTYLEFCSECFPYLCIPVSFISFSIANRVDATTKIAGGGRSGGFRVHVLNFQSCMQVE